MASHLLANGSDIPGRLDDALPAVMMLVQLVAEALKHVVESAAGHFVLLVASIAVVVSLNATGHGCCAEARLSDMRIR